MLDLGTAAQIRDFLRLCLTPQGRVSRTHGQLAKVMPDWLRGPLHTHAPHLADLQAAAARLERQAVKARSAYVEAMRAWIEEPDTQTTEGTR